MKKIENMDFYTLNENAKFAIANKVKNWSPKLEPDFLDHTLPVLACIPLVKDEKGHLNPRLIMEAMDNYNMIKTPNGQITGHNLRYLISFLYKCPRKPLIKGTQIANSRLAKLTPLTFYANKLYRDIPYSAWQHDCDGSTKLMLGYDLQHLLGIKDKPELTTQEILEFRKKSLTYTHAAAKAGQVDKLTAYRMNIQGLGKDNIEFPRIVMHMVLQTWLANAEVRNIDSMILDPWDWDNIPAPIDQVAQIAAKPPTAQLDEWDVTL